MQTYLLQFCLISVATATVFGASPRISKELHDVDADQLVDVIVQFKAAPTDAHYQKVRNQGGVDRLHLEVAKAGAFRIKASALEALAADSDVEFISPDRPLRGTFSDPTPDWSAYAMGAPYAWRNYSGPAGIHIGVAVIDSGISPASDLQFDNGQNRIVYNQSFVSGDSSTGDAYGHGTHVAGILAGTGNRSSGLYIGVGPHISLVNLRVLDSNGNGNDSAVIAAIQRAIQLKTQFNIRVMNLSLGRPVFESYTQDPLCQAVEAAWKAGITVVVAAGNGGRNNAAQTNGYGTITAPGNDPYVITVGAMKTMQTQTRADDLIASYSSKGPTAVDHIVKPDLVASGNKVVSVLYGTPALAALYPDAVVTPSYLRLSGTSMATPMVSGAAALLSQKGLLPDQIKAVLMKTASKSFPASSVAIDPITNQSFTTYYDIFTVGAGYLDIQAALASTDVATGAALSPIASYNNANHSVTISNIAGSNIVWGTNVWGTNVVWGTSTMSSSSSLWGTNIVWGTTTMSGFNVVWGTSTLGAQSNSNNQDQSELDSVLARGEN